MALDVNGNIIDIKEELDFSLQSPSKSRHAQISLSDKFSEIWKTEKYLENDSREGTSHQAPKTEPINTQIKTGGCETNVQPPLTISSFFTNIRANENGPGHAICLICQTKIGNMKSRHLKAYHADIYIDFFIQDEVLRKCKILSQKATAKSDSSSKVFLAKQVNKNTAIEFYPQSTHSFNGMYLPELRLGLNTRLLDWKRNSPFRNCKFSDCDPLAIFIRTIDPSTAPPMCCVHCKAVLREEISKLCLTWNRENLFKTILDFVYFCAIRCFNFKLEQTYLRENPSYLYLVGYRKLRTFNDKLLSTFSTVVRFPHALLGAVLRSSMVAVNSEVVCFCDVCGTLTSSQLVFSGRRYSLASFKFLSRDMTRPDTESFYLCPRHLKLTRLLYHLTHMEWNVHWNCYKRICYIFKENPSYSSEQILNSINPQVFKNLTLLYYHLFSELNALGSKVFYYSHQNVKDSRALLMTMLEMNNDGLEPLNDDDCEEGISPITNGGLQEQFDGGEIDIKRWTRLLRMIKIRTIFDQTLRENPENLTMLD